VQPKGSPGSSAAYRCHTWAAWRPVLGPVPCPFSGAYLGRARRSFRIRPADAVRNLRANGFSVPIAGGDGFDGETEWARGGNAGALVPGLAASIKYGLG